MCKKLTIILMFVPMMLLAQSKTVTGKVTSGSDGQPLPGVTILVKGTTQGVSTDFDGNYSIEVKENAVLQFSYMGFTTQEVSVVAKSNINVVLKEDAQALDEVVVTALGIKREEKTLTYSQQKIGSEEISKTKDLNFANSLMGKTSGVQLTKSSSGAGGSTKIVLRGNKSVVGVSSPLFVIDGVPMSNDVPNANSDSVFNNRDKSDALSQINPDDIETITVLKGSNAAILYGSQGANGVIMITTKSAKEGKLSGSFSSSISFEEVIEIPKLQYRYGSKGGEENWDTKKGNYNNSFVKNFFKTGITSVNSISITGGNKNNSSYLSYANTSSEGVVEKNKYVKHNLSIKQSNKYLDEKLGLSARVMLTDEKVENKPQTGYYFNPLTGLYWFPRNLDFSKYKNQYEVLNSDRNILTQSWHILNVDKQQNPYWIINRNRSENKVKRMIANIGADYKINDKINIQVRGNYDYATYEFSHRLQAGTSSVLSHENGTWKYSLSKSIQVYGDAMLTYKNTFGDFDVNAILGTSYENKNLRDGISLDSGHQGLKYANEFNFQNLGKEVHVINTIDSRSEKQSVFGNVEIGYKNMLYVDLSARNDWASTLAFTNNTSYFYPSFGFTALLDRVIELPQYVNLAKLRASYAMVSNDVPSFITHPLSKIGRNGIEANTTKPFTEMKPEEQRSFEIGLDVRLFSRRLGLDFTYYKIDSKNQFINLPAPSGSGYTTYYVNAGHIRNSGIEATINAIPIKSKEWEWGTHINFSKNNNKIFYLHKDLKGKYSLNDTDGYALYLTEGGSFGDIYVNKFVRDKQGRIIISDKGKPERTSEKELVGNAQPNFALGWNNTISYKNASLSFLIDGKFGGKAVSLTNSMLDAYGASERTAVARDLGKVTINGVDKSGKSVTSITPEAYYKATGGRDGIIENYVYDATNVRLRQLAMTYNFNLSTKKSFFKKVSLSLIANNLFFLYNNAPFDPELSMSTGNKLQSVDLFTIPATRNYGMNLKINF